MADVVDEREKIVIARRAIGEGAKKNLCRIIISLSEQTLYKGFRARFSGVLSPLLDHPIFVLHYWNEYQPTVSLHLRHAFHPCLGHFTLVRGHLLPQPLGPLEHNMPCMNPWFILSDSSLSPCLQSSIRERGEMTNCFPWIRLYDTMPDASFWHNNSR